jgi:hypothetical protein
MALQKCLLEQSDITKIIGEFQFQMDENEQLIVLNPPVVSLEEELTSNDTSNKEKQFTTGSD